MPEPMEQARDLVARELRRWGGRMTKRHLEINGRAVEVQAGPLDSLARVLAERSLSVRASCDLDGCGGCRVLLDGELVDACTVPMIHAEGASVVTSEGLKSDPLLAPVRRALARMEPRPCDACLPGLLVATRAFFDVDARLPGETAGEALSSDRCSCAGSALFVELVEDLARPVRSRPHAAPRAARQGRKPAPRRRT